MKVKVPTIVPRNPIVAPAMIRPGAGKHAKSEKSRRQQFKMELKKELAH